MDCIQPGDVVAAIEEDVWSDAHLITFDHSAVAATNTATVTEEEAPTRETSCSVSRLPANETTVEDNVPRATTDTLTTSNAVGKSKRCNNKKQEVVVNEQGICTRGQTASNRRFIRGPSGKTSGLVKGGNSEGRVTRGRKRVVEEEEVKTSEVKNTKNNDNNCKNKKRRLF